MLKQITNLTELNELTQNNQTVVVDFYAKWCRPCSVMMPQVERAAEELTNVTFVKVDVDESPELASTYGVMGLPTVIQFRDGAIHDQFTGTRPTDYFLTWVE